jgi:hypothetical protein
MWWKVDLFVGLEPIALSSVGLKTRKRLRTRYFSCGFFLARLQDRLRPMYFFHHRQKTSRRAGVANKKPERSIQGASMLNFNSVLTPIRHDLPFVILTPRSTHDLHAHSSGRLGRLSPL